MVSNNDWQETQAQALRDANLAPANDLESAILATLAPGAYTAILRGKGSATGIGLVEVYDLQTERRVEARQSQHAWLGRRRPKCHDRRNDRNRTGCRASRFSRPRPIAGGRRDSESDSPIRKSICSMRTAPRFSSNNNWKDSQQAAIAATGLAPANDLESAILADLAPGNYTAVVSGVSGATGIALVEAYHLQ